MTVTLLALAAATVVYVVDAVRSPGGPRGGSVVGMAFGIAGSLLMLFAGLLSLRKRLPGWRLGSSAVWLKGHLWLGLLSGPLVLFHSGFRWGGWLETIVLGLALLIIASGLVGLALQQLLPRTMRGMVAAEAMHEQLPSVCAALRATGDEAMTAACGGAVLLDPSTAPGDARALLAEFYRETIRPFLDAAPPRDSLLRETTGAASALAQVRQRMPAHLQGSVDRLGDLCDERRQLLLQERLHGWLHGWLLVHVPLSAALLVLGLAHAVLAVWY
jgi:hypothetical protein